MDVGVKTLRYTVSLYPCEVTRNGRKLLTHCSDRKKYDSQPFPILFGAVPYLRADHKIPTLGMIRPESGKMACFEGIDIPLALDCIDDSATARQHEIDFPPLLVAPENDFGHRDRGQSVE